MSRGIIDSFCRNNPQKITSVLNIGKQQCSYSISSKILSKSFDVIDYGFIEYAQYSQVLCGFTLKRSKLEIEMHRSIEPLATAIAENRRHHVYHLFATTIFGCPKLCFNVQKILLTLRWRHYSHWPLPPLSKRLSKLITKHQTPHYRPFVRGINRWLCARHTNGPIVPKQYPCHTIIMHKISLKCLP